MKKLIRANYFFSLFVVLLCYSKLYSQAITHLQKKGTTQQLIVDGKPFLILGGETGVVRLKSKMKIINQREFCRLKKEFIIMVNGFREEE